MTSIDFTAFLTEFFYVYVHGGCHFQTGMAASIQVLS